MPTWHRKTNSGVRDAALAAGLDGAGDDEFTGSASAGGGAVGGGAAGDPGGGASHDDEGTGARSATRERALQKLTKIDRLSENFNMNASDAPAEAKAEYRRLLRLCRNRTNQLGVRQVSAATFSRPRS